MLWGIFFTLYILLKDKKCTSYMTQIAMDDFAIQVGMHLSQLGNRWSFAIKLTNHTLVSPSISW